MIYIFNDTLLNLLKGKLYMSMQIDVDLKILDNEFYSEFQLPEYKTPGSAGVDLRANIKEPLTIKYGETKLIATGLAIGIKNPSVMGAIFPRSGLGHKLGIVLGNLTGIIDSDYTGEIFLSVWNRNSYEDVEIDRGDRLAQLIFIPVYTAKFNIINELEETERGNGGFGHTGTQ